MWKKPIVRAHMREHQSVYVQDDKPKAVKEHAWSAILLSKERTKEMRIKKKRQRGSQRRMNKKEEGRGNKTGGETERRESKGRKERERER